MALKSQNDFLNNTELGSTTHYPPATCPKSLSGKVPLMKLVPSSLTSEFVLTITHCLQILLQQILAQAIRISSSWITCLCSD